MSWKERAALATERRYADANLSDANAAIAVLLARATAAEERVAELEREIKRWNILVAQDCTPSGSEFHNDPERCKRWIKEREASMDRLWRNAEERCKRLEARIDAAIEIIEDEDDDPADPLLVRIHTALSREGEKAKEDRT